MTKGCPSWCAIDGEAVQCVQTGTHAAHSAMVGVGAHRREVMWRTQRSRIEAMADAFNQREATQEQDA